MQVLVNSDHHILGGEDLTERVRGMLEGRLERFAGRITRVEVHLSDLNGTRLGERDKRCMLEARLGGLKPIAASHEAPTLTEAIHVAADKLERAVEHALGKLADSAGRGGGPAAMEALERTGADQRTQPQRP
jgi:ribosome-associated translation inhibitor RaiA